VDSVSAFRVKLGASDLNCVDVPLNPTHSLKLQLGGHICRTNDSRKVKSLVFSRAVERLIFLIALIARLIILIAR